MAELDIAAHRGGEFHGDWRRDAACAGTDPELWHPSGSGQYAAAYYARGKRYCHRCPVRLECLRTVLALEERSGRHGLWAGLTPEERADPATVAAVVRALETSREEVGCG